jgi:CRP/FNR family transcriptional regulator, cyclic AMP receptor protein
VAENATFNGRGFLSELPNDLATDLFGTAVRFRLKAGNSLFQAGDVGDGCYRVEEGLLKVTIASRSGSERILTVLGPGDIVGELSMIDGLPRSASVSAVREATLSFVKRAAFKRLVRKCPELCEMLVMLLAKRLRETDGVVAAMSFLRLRGRLARVLLELAQDFGQDVGSGRIVIRQKIAHNDLAAMVGTARENVTRILNDWKRNKLVTKLSGYYCLENKARLEEQGQL